MYYARLKSIINLYLDCELLPTFKGASFEHVSACTSFHSGPKSVNSHTTTIFWLISSFRHDFIC